MATNNVFTQKPYQTNQSTQPKTAAASSVSSQPPANAFMQGLNGAWSGIKNTVSGVGNYFGGQNGLFTNPVGWLGATNAPGGLENYGKTNQPQVAKTPPTSALNSAGIPIDVAAPPVGTPGVKTVAQVNADKNKQTNQQTGNSYQVADSSQSSSNTPNYTPISGSSTGAKVDANGNMVDANGNPIKADTGSQSNYINNLANTTNPDLRQQVINSMANFKNPAYYTAIQNVANLETQQGAQVQGILGQPIPVSAMTGQAGVAIGKSQNDILAQTQLANAAQTEGQQRISAGQNVLSATQPQLGGIGSQQYYYPGSAMGGTQGGGTNGGIQLTGQASTDLNTFAQDVANGTSGMSYNQALSQLSSAYGSVVANQLLGAVQKINPQFNMNQSNATATTQTANSNIAAQMTPAIGAVNSVLSNNNANDTNTLLGAFNALGALQKTGSGIITGGVNDFINATGLGGTAQTQNYTRLLGEARTDVNNMLQTAKNLGVNVGADSAQSLLPDNMTEVSLKQAISNIQSIAQKFQSQYANAGSGNNSNSSSGNGWTSLGD
jgi:hypothetical protein